MLSSSAQPEQAHAQSEHLLPSLRASLNLMAQFDKLACSVGSGDLVEADKVHHIPLSHPHSSPVQKQVAIFWIKEVLLQ